MAGVKKDEYKFVECYCPRCEEYYKRYLFWTGRGTPKILCPICKERAKCEN